MRQAAMRKIVLIDTSPTIDEPESKREARPVALVPLILVAAIVAFIVWASDRESTPGEHMASPYLQARMAP
jgi:hypothetical protein